MEFDVFRYVLIFLMIFGHNLGTKERSCFVVDRLFQR
jgi:fucose 4-O-acetylase-like acetyltransferase